MMPLSWQTGQYQSIRSSSSALGYDITIPGQRCRGGRRRQRTVGGSSRLLVASSTMLAKYSARMRAPGGNSAIAPVGVK